jgi:hypothetical protein
MSKYVPGVYKHAKPSRARAKKPRACLLCRKTFTSRWIGERVCGNCKLGDRWQNGNSSLEP